jgi:hypothetical protein
MNFIALIHVHSLCLGCWKAYMGRAFAVASNRAEGNNLNPLTTRVKLTVLIVFYLLAVYLLDSFMCH